MSLLTLNFAIIGLFQFEGMQVCDMDVCLSDGYEKGCARKHSLKKLL